MVNYAVTNIYSPLQVSISVMLNSKSLIESLNRYFVCASYEEFRRLRSSIAHHVMDQQNQSGHKETSTTDNFYQYIVDNFDLDISSQNGMKSKHSLEMIFAETSNSPSCPTGNANKIKKS